MITEEDFQALASSVDRRATWGADDRLGALRYLTAAATAAAAQEVITGTVISCAARPRGTFPSIATRLDTADAWAAVNEVLTVEQHGPSSMTHFDGLGHFFYQGHTHAGVPQSVVEPAGVTDLDVVPASGGIVGRGLLLDLPAIAGVPYLPLDQDVSITDIRKALDRAAVAPRSGDVLVVRTGAAVAPVHAAAGLPAVGSLNLDCARWIHDEEFSLVISDAGLDSPAPTVSRVATPWHILAITRMGVSLVDFADLETLATACAERGRLTFLVSLGVLPISRATASPVNPVVVL